MAKLCGEDRPAMAIGQISGALVEFALRGRADPRSADLGAGVYLEEIERVVGEYTRLASRGVLRWMEKRCAVCAEGEEGGDYLLSVYDVTQGKVLSQLEVGRKKTRSPRLPPP